MNVRLTVVPLSLLAVVTLSSIPSLGRELTFQERVAAQEAIERVYYFHQIGTAKPFQEAVPRNVLEKKVSTYLKQSVALESFWATPIDRQMLQQELDRMTRSTQLPGRLRELFAALGNDPVLIEECLARPVLADRLARRFFAHDDTIHAPARIEAEAIRRELVNGRLSTSAHHPNRTVIELVREDRTLDTERLDSGGRDTIQLADGTFSTILPSEGFNRQARDFGDRPGNIGSVIEEVDAFVIRVVLDRTPDRLHASIFRVEKESWDSWWMRIEDDLDELSIEVEGRALDSAPRSIEDLLNGVGPGCAADDIWAVTLLNTPDVRDVHTGVWTGSVMIVWGGKNGSSGPTMNTGGRYDPATDSWLPTSTLNAPTPRYFHVAVWTGQEMIVWAGKKEGSTRFMTGGRYDPAADTWTPTSTVDAPAARVAPTAVWTGSEMIVWGGLTGSSTSTDTGGRYDPSSDTWVATSTVGAPTRRSSHGTVWAGSEMIVWGGRSDPSTKVNTGGSYDPLTDSWSATSTLNAPGPRFWHSVVWTGDRMIVWGGSGETTGGSYDLALVSCV